MCSLPFLCSAMLLSHHVNGLRNLQSSGLCHCWVQFSAEPSLPKWGPELRRWALLIRFIFRRTAAPPGVPVAILAAQAQMAAMGAETSVAV